MGESDERIDIELTSGGADPSPFARAAGEHVVVTPPADGEPVSGSGRVVLAVALVGIAGLLLGWILGRSSESTSEPVPLTVVPASSIANPVETLDTVAPSTAPATTAPDPPTASDTAPTADVSRAEPVVDDIELDARLVGLPIEIVAIGADRRLVTVDLTLGTLTVFAVEAQPFGRPMVYVGDDWTLIPSADAALPSTLVRGAPPTEHVDQVDVGVAADIVGVDGDVIWVAQPTATVDVSVRSIDLAAGSDEATSPDIVVPADPAGGDPAGGVVVSAPGGWYRVDDSTRERLTGGELIALGTDLMLVRDCSENLDCSLFVLDRADGRATRIEARSDSSDTRRWSIERLDGCPAQISPDGSAALVGVNDGSAPGPATVLGLFDLTTGNLSVIGETGAADQCAFTPDGRFVFFLRSGGGMFAFDRSDGDVIEVVDGRLTPEAFGVRSAGG